MNYSKSFKTCVFQKYATFKGTSTRSEYWWFWITYWCVLIGLPIVSFLLDNMGIKLYFLMVLWAIGSVGLAVPFVAVSVRRLHDGGFSGWHFFWRAIPIIGNIITIVLMCQPSKHKSNIPSSNQDKLFCHYCGKHIGDLDGNFCKFCGKPL